MKRKHSTKRALIASVVSLCLCFSMLIGTTYAWFTDSVTSSGNIIQTGSLDIGFQWADAKEDPASANWTNVEGALFDYANWEPGYTVAKHLRISNDGSLALKYQMRITTNGVVTNLADVIDVYVIADEDVDAMSRVDLDSIDPVGTLTEVLGTSNNLSKKINGKILAKEAANVYTLVLKMQESAGNEYQNMDLGCTFTIELLATQLSAEKDSFGKDYDDDTIVPDESIPAALVRPVEELEVNATRGIGGAAEKIKLDAGYQFEPTISYEDVLNSSYKYWHADFVVSADATVPAGSIALAGYYEEWCKLNNYNWVALVNESDTIPANTEIRLVDYLGTTVNWRDICKYGNDGKGFQCGIADLTGANAGTTVTVELRLYATGAQGDCAEGGGCTHPYVECELGEYITVGEFKYTFGSKDDTTNITVVENATELQAALDAAVEGKTNFINFAADIAGDVTVTQPSNADVDVVINGCGYKYDGIITLKGLSSFNGENDDSLIIKNINFETNKAPVSDRPDAFIWTADTKNGTDFRYVHNVSVENCTFTAVEGSAAQNAFVGVKVQQAYNIAVINSTATNMHSLMQAESCGSEVSVDGCKVINCKSGVSFNNTLNAVITNTEIESVVDGGYGIRHKGQVDNYSLTVENCTIKAFVPVLIRNMTGNGYTATFEGENDFTATNDFGYEVVVSAGDWDNDASVPTAPTGSYTLVGANGFSKNVD